METNLSQSNPYASGRILYDSEGVKTMERTPYFYEPAPEDVPYMLKKGDTLAKIAGEHYEGFVENPDKYGHIIGDANGIPKRFALSEFPGWGATIIVPSMVRYLIMMEL